MLGMQETISWQKGLVVKQCFPFEASADDFLQRSHIPLGIISHGKKDVLANRGKEESPPIDIDVMLLLEGGIVF